MKDSLKKFFILGVAVAAAAVAVSHSPKIKRAITDLVKKNKLTREQGEKLHQELMEHISKIKTGIKSKLKK
jgi:polyhydroxyalkanoate synthesis regulator phasin